MTHTFMRENWPTKMQLWREIAHLGGAVCKTDDRPHGVCKSNFVDGLSSKQATLHCQLVCIKVGMKTMLEQNFTASMIGMSGKTWTNLDI